MTPTYKEDTPVFKNTNGVHFLKEIFFETSLKEEKPYVLYTLKNYDHQGYPSLRRLYLEEDDITEYLVAEKYFDGWPHWKKLLQCSWFLEVLNPIREELETRHKAQYLKSLRLDALKGDKPSSKFLLDRLEDKSGKGRPTKARIAQEAQKIVKSSEEIQDDFLRMKEMFQ